MKHYKINDFRSLMASFIVVISGMKWSAKISIDLRVYEHSTKWNGSYEQFKKYS